MYEYFGKAEGFFHSTQVTELEQFGYLSWCREQTNNNVLQDLMFLTTLQRRMNVCPKILILMLL